MSTITIVTVAGGGNVPPAEAIARELIARGHGVQVLGQEHQRTRFEAAGADFTALDSLEFWGDGKGKEDGPGDREQRGAARLESCDQGGGRGEPRAYLLRMRSSSMC